MYLVFITSLSFAFNQGQLNYNVASCYNFMIATKTLDGKSSFSTSAAKLKL